jgi:cytochrome c-type biogenesis protein CcsB
MEETMNSSTLFTVATLSYLAAMVLYISYLAFKKNKVGLVASGVTYFGLGIQTIALILRWVESYEKGIGRVPLSNLYESLVFFSWSTVLIYVIIEYKYKTRAFGAFVIPVAFLALAFINVAGIAPDITPLVPALKSNWLFYHVLISFFGYAAFGVAFAISMIYLLMNTDERGSAVNLFSALGVLVVLTVLGYVMTSWDYKKLFWMGLGILMLCWIVYLIAAGTKKSSQVYLFWTFCMTLAGGLLIAMGVDYLLFKFKGLPTEESFRRHMFESTFLNISKPIVVVICWAAVAGLFSLVWSQGLKLKALLKSYVPSPDMLEDVNYRMIAIGWPLLTAGIITGAVWANSAWGTYWGWDPKETWSLITWFVYGIYLHLRLAGAQFGVKRENLPLLNALFAIVGFAFVVFTYLGVSYLLRSLHSYAAG